MIGAIVSLFNGGLETYRQYNRIKAEALKRKDELDQEKHQARVRRLQKGEEQASGLDEVSIRGRGFKDEFILLVVFIPLILSFIPDYAPYVEQGFEALKNIPEPYWYVVGLSSSIPLACAPWFAICWSSSQASLGGSDGTTGSNAYLLNHWRGLKRGHYRGAQN